MMKKFKNGKWKEFNKHAVLVSEGEYVDNVKHGTWRQFYDFTGALLIEENYKDGVQHGRYRSFHPNGKVFSEGEFINGLREGYFRVYDDQGTNVRTLLFANGIQIEDTNEQAYKKTQPAERTTGT